jgi:peptide/nickel transport system substrate-binding protein
MRMFVFALAGFFAFSSDGWAGVVNLKEADYFTKAVKEGSLPPVAQRVPIEPLTARFDRKGTGPGQAGGTIRILMAKAKEIRQMVVYGYARLVAYDDRLTLRADILKDFKIEQGRIFTFTLRKGHRWSNGDPFTTEDFRYWWEDVATNEELYPSGPPVQMLVDGELPSVDVISETKIRFTWRRPNPEFLPALAQASPLYIYAPSKYLKQFHPKYQQAQKLFQMVEAENRRNWASLHNRKDNAYKNDNPELPSLQPWIARTAPPAERFIFSRNPFYHRVDGNGVQLPYLDEVHMDIVAGKLIPAKAGSGEVDLQGRYLSFNDTPFLKQNEEQYGFVTHLWRTGKGSHLALYPNLNIQDKVWRELFRDLRFRRALSIATNREEINEVVYFGLAIPQNNSLLPGSPLYDKKSAYAFANFDVKGANNLLDEIGLKYGSGGIRLLPDGRKAEIIIETAGESTEETDVLQLVHDTWLQAGIKIYTKPLQREVLRNRVFSGQTQMAIWSGLQNGLASPEMSPGELAPTSQQQLQWPMWGQYLETKGSAGQEIDLPAARIQFERYIAWRESMSSEQKKTIWSEMIKTFNDQVFTIGLVSGALQPVVVNARLRNVPAEGYYNWDPGAHFGTYRPDTFWLAAK